MECSSRKSPRQENKSMSKRFQNLTWAPTARISNMIQEEDKLKNMTRKQKASGFSTFTYLDQLITMIV